MNQLPPAEYDKHTKIWSAIQIQSMYNLEHHSLGRILFEQMRNYPNKVIQIDDVDGKSITNREALNWAIRIAQFFKKERLRYDDIVGISARNSTYVMPVALGCYLNCVPFHAVNPQADEKTLEHCYSITKPSIIFCDGCDYEKIQAATKSFKPKIYTVAEHKEGVASVMDLLEPSKTEMFYQPENLIMGSDQTVAILCSSGTSGLPKAVTISVNKLGVDAPFYTSEDVIFSTSGMDWISGVMAMTSNCKSGCTRIITSKPFSPEYFMSLVAKYKITNVALAPYHIVALTTYPKYNKENTASIRVVTVGGGAIAKSTLEKAQAALANGLIAFGYGLTEAGGVSGFFGLERCESVGKLIPNVQLRIVDDDGINLGPKQMGEIYVRYPYDWAGYYGNPMETLKMKDSLGWIHTADVGYMDEEGFLYLVDRKKEICKYQALQYAPSEIESCISELPDVVDCCVAAIFDEKAGDVAGALVVKKPSSSLTQEQIVNHVKQRLVVAQKQLHNGVQFVEQLPYSMNGKLLRKEAKQILKNILEKKTLDR